MKGTGKHVLLNILKELSLWKLPDSELENATARLRAALLLHGSTSDDNFHRVRRLCWGRSGSDEDGIRQGVSFLGGKLLLLDFMEEIFQMPGLKDFMKSRFPSISDEEFDAARWALWVIVSAPTMFEGLIPSEVVDSELTQEAYITNYIEKHRSFFEDDQT